MIAQKMKPFACCSPLLPGGYQLLVGAELEETQDLLDQLFKATLIAISIIFALSAIIGSLMARKMLRSINATRNEELMQSMQQVTNNLAHDLRNPLNRIRHRLESARYKAMSDDEFSDFNEDTINDIDGVISTFNSLLSIAQIESGESRKSWENFQLNELLDDLSELYEVVASEQGLKWNYQIEETLKLNGSKQLLAQLFTNLLDNAIQVFPRKRARKIKIMTIRKFESHLPNVHPTAYVDETALVSGEVEIGEDSSVWPMTVIRGDVNYIKIGKRTNIQDASVLHVTHAPNEHSEKIGAAQTGYALIIGDDVTVGHKALLHACEIRDRVLVGMGAIVMDGTVVEEETMIAAGSVVPPRKTLESGILMGGVFAAEMPFTLSITGKNFEIKKSLSISEAKEDKNKINFDFKDKSGADYNFDLKYKTLPKNRSYPTNLDITIKDGSWQ
ncbi:Protein YrdA [Nymphon striatum]|nr:Protein YrdA [Nymphon striatum]